MPADFLKKPAAGACQNRSCPDSRREARYDDLTKLVLCDECWSQVPARRLDAPQPAAERCGGK